MRSTPVLDFPSAPIVSGETIVAIRQAAKQREYFPVHEDPERVERANWDETNGNADCASSRVVELSSVVVPSDA